VGAWVSGWVSEWVGVGGWAIEWLSEWVSGCVGEWVGEWVSGCGWASERVSQWVSEWASEWVSEGWGEWIGRRSTVLICALGVYLWNNVLWAWFHCTASRSSGLLKNILRSKLPGESTATLPSVFMPRAWHTRNKRRRIATKSIKRSTRIGVKPNRIFKQ